MSRSRIRLLVAVAAFVAATVVVDAVLGRVYIPAIVTVPHPSYHHDFKPNDEATQTWGDERYVFRTNSLGFKDRSTRQVALTSDTHRIVFIGDSFTEGVGYPFDDTFVGRIEGSLDRTRFDVLNAAVSSYSPRWYYLKTKFLVETVGLRFDELVVFLDVSDVPDEVLYEDAVIPTRPWARTVDAFFRQRSFVYWAFLRDVLQGGYHNVNRSDDEQATWGSLFDAYYESLDAWTDRDDLWHTVGLRGARLAAEYMDRLHRLCARHGIMLSLAVYPWPRQIRAGALESRQVTIWRQFARERGLSFLDYFPVFIGPGEPESTIRAYYIDGDVHWNAAGHRRVAEEWLRMRQRQF